MQNFSGNFVNSHALIGEQVYFVFSAGNKLFSWREQNKASGKEPSKEPTI